MKHFTYGEYVLNAYTKLMLNNITVVKIDGIKIFARVCKQDYNHIQYLIRLLVKDRKLRFDCDIVDDLVLLKNHTNDKFKINNNYDVYVTILIGQDYYDYDNFRQRNVSNNYHFNIVDL